MTKRAEVIAIGDEITSGQRLDTNSQWLSQRLGEAGIVTLFHSTVGDDFDACVRVFREAIDRAEIVVMTGGLGPTQDDLTRRALASAAGLEIEIRQEAIDHIQTMFSRRGRTMPERNRLQAEFPAGSRIVHNPQGTAPGIDLTIPRQGRAPSRVICFPGVPAEMKQMWTETVAAEVAPTPEELRHVKHHVIKCFGLGESDMESLIPELIARDHVPRVGITVNRATISIRISADAQSEEACDQQIDQVRSVLQDRVGDLIFGEGDEFQMQHAVANLLEQNSQTLCSIEIGYNSEIDSWMGALERPDLYFGGLSLVDDQAVRRWQNQFSIEGVNDRDELFTKIREMYDSDWLVVVDAYPSVVPKDGSPLPGSDVQLTVEGRTLKTPQKLNIHLGGHPDVLPPRIAKTGLDLLRKTLLMHQV